VSSVIGSVTRNVSSATVRKGPPSNVSAGTGADGGRGQRSEKRSDHESVTPTGRPNE